MQIVGWNPSADGSGRGACSNLRDFIQRRARDQLAISSAAVGFVASANETFVFLLARLLLVLFVLVQHAKRDRETKAGGMAEEA